MPRSQRTTQAAPQPAERPQVEVCRECFPLGLPDGAASGGCEHGVFYAAEPEPTGEETEGEEPEGEGAQE